MKDSKNFLDENLQGKDLEDFTEKFLKAKFDRDRKKRWEHILEEKFGINRNNDLKKNKIKSWQLYLWVLIILIFVFGLISILIF